MSQCRIISLSLILYIYYSKKKKTRKRNKNKKRRNAPWLRILLDLKEILDSIYYYIWRRKWQPTSVYCLENPMDRGVLQAPVHGVTRVRHDLATKPPSPPLLHHSSSFIKELETKMSLCPKKWNCRLDATMFR